MKISLKFVPKGPINNVPSSVLDNGLTPSRRQAIIWTNGGKFTEAYMRHSASVSQRIVSTSAKPQQNTIILSPREQYNCHFADDKFKFMNERFCILIRISLKFAPQGLVDNNAALVHVIVWRRTGDKPLPGPMLTQFTNSYMWH